MVEQVFTATGKERATGRKGRNKCSLRWEGNKEKTERETAKKARD